MARVAEKIQEKQGFETHAFCQGLNLTIDQIPAAAGGRLVVRQLGWVSLCFLAWSGQYCSTRGGGTADSSLALTVTLWE